MYYICLREYQPSQENIERYTQKLHYLFGKLFQLKKNFLSSLFWKSPLLNKPIIDTTHVSSKGSVIILEKSWNAGRPELI